VEVGIDAASLVERDLEQRELGAVGFDRDPLAGAQGDRVVHLHGLLDQAHLRFVERVARGDVGDELLPGHSATLLREPHDDNGRWIETTVAGRVELVEAGVPAAHVVGEAERRHVEVEGTCMRARVVVEAMRDAGREEDECACRKRVRPVAEVERELAVDDEEGIRVLAVHVSLRSMLARAVVELGDGDLVGLDEYGGAPPRPVGDRVALRASHPPDHDESGIGRYGVRRRPLVEPGHIATDVAAVARARCVESEEPRRPVAGHLDRVHDLGRDECPALRADPMHAILELERELSLEHVQRLAVSSMDVGRRFPPSGSSAHVDRGELLDVREKRDAELLAAEDHLACADLDHVPAA